MLSEQMRAEIFYITDSVSRVNATVIRWADKVAQLEARIKALEANTSKSVLRRLDIQLGGSDDD